MRLRAGRRQGLDLSRAGLVVAAAPGRRRLVVAALALALAYAAGAGTAALRLHEPADPAEAEQRQQMLDQQRLAQALARAHAQELERQIETLNQQLRACQEELTFFRRTRDAKR
ncbi:hypothetical protein RA210_U90064 [Rubrivivax sp. A210]|uniref:hypothetical protein n=1 Tax=Rubrivivax sp. A210 TaxID=2772301 RepID=UPI001918C2D4|nr:hypothetical protein [Rubrivivax sp. A210]CAD5375175.1 hypothetical protein RA210_U90064 [Rubrivivax sp. A210]